MGILRKYLISRFTASPISRVSPLPLIYSGYRLSEVQEPLLAYGEGSMMYLTYD